MADKIDERVEQTIDALGQTLAAVLPDGVGFFVLCFEFNAKPGTKNFSVSNADRTTLVAGLSQWLVNLEEGRIKADEENPEHPRYRPPS